MSNLVLRVCIWILGFVALVGNTFVILWRSIYSSKNKVGTLPGHLSAMISIGGVTITYIIFIISDAVFLLIISSLLLFCCSMPSSSGVFVTAILATVTSSLPPSTAIPRVEILSAARRCTRS